MAGLYVLTWTERLQLMREGQRAFREGRPVTDCPYDVLGPPRESAYAGAWVRGWAVTLNHATQYAD